MMNSRLFVRAACCIVLLAGPLVAFAEALVKPLPQPDMSKLPAEEAKQLSASRADFDKARVGLVGNALAAAYAEMGALYMRTGFDDVAAIAFYDATQLAPQDSRWLYMSGVLARDLKRNADARADFEAAIALDKNYAPAAYRLADTLVDVGDNEGARKVLQQATQQHADSAPAFAMLGRLELKQKQYAQAVEHLQQALKIEPAANALYEDLATAYTALGKADAAAEAHAKAGVTPPTIDDPLVAGLYTRSAPPVSGTPLEQAQQLLAQRDFAGARGRLEIALKADANNVDAVALAARLDALLGKQAAAQQEASRALTLKADSAMANLSQGVVYEFGGNETQAFAYYQRALQADPKQPDARLLVGNALMRRGQYADAAEQYRQLAIANPSSEVESRVVAAEVAAGHCGNALANVNASLAKRAQDGDLMQLFVRLSSTCSAATAQERSMALDYALALYKQRPNAADTTALALAQAAQGKFEDAQKSQAEAIYEAVRVGDNERATLYRETMRQFAAKQLPDRPWPAQHPYFKPPPLAPLPAVAPAKPQ